jgi:chorismate mutase
MNEMNEKIHERLTRRFYVMAAVARRKFSANLEVGRPHEVHWKPPLRQAAGFAKGKTLRKSIGRLVQ